MGVCADLGSHRWCRALSTTQHNSTQQSEEQDQQLDQQSLEIPSRSPTTIPATKTLTASPAKTAAFTVKTTRRRRSRRRAEGSSIWIPLWKGQGSTPTIQVLQLVLVSLLALLAKNAQAHNIPGECSAIKLLN